MSTPAVEPAADLASQLASLVRADSVHKRVCTDPALFALEMKYIYGRAWVYVGHESQVPATGDW